MKIKLSNPITTDSIVDGPGLRSVIWTQGCPHNCKNCHNPTTHDFNGGYDEEVENIVNIIKNLKLQKGITISGGEPLRQIKELIPICKESKKLGLDIWLFTGYQFEYIWNFRNDKFEYIEELFNYIDVLVDGKFDESKKSLNLKFRGSSNQRIIDIKKTIVKKELILLEEYMNCD